MKTQSGSRLGILLNPACDHMRKMDALVEKVIPQLQQSAG
jgi:hypothetical protein